jgi:hypothetical protein
VDPDRQLTEIASWHLVTELCRRHPVAFEVIEAHPSGGQSDCLALYTQEAGISAVFNRPGSFAVFKNFENEDDTPGDSEIWKKMISYGVNQKTLLEEVERKLALPAPSKLPSTTRKVLSFRIMAAFLRLTAFSLEIREWRNGYHDTSGFGGGRNDKYFNLFPQLKERLRESKPTDPLNEPSYRFWFLIDEPWTSESALVCIENTAYVHYRDGTTKDLMASYKELNRNVYAVMATHLLQFAPQ